MFVHHVQQDMYLVQDHALLVALVLMVIVFHAKLVQQLEQLHVLVVHQDIIKIQIINANHAQVL